MILKIVEETEDSGLTYRDQRASRAAR